MDSAERARDWLCHDEAQVSAHYVLGHDRTVWQLVDEDERAWIIRVADTGPGLPAKAREHLFKPFQGGATKGGTGLGLTIAQDLVRGHGGTLSLERSDETGTSFCITLPKGNLADVS